MMAKLKVFKLGPNALQGSGNPPYEKEMWGASVEGVALCSHGDTEDDAVCRLAEELGNWVIGHRSRIVELGQKLGEPRMVFEAEAKKRVEHYDSGYSRVEVDFQGASVIEGHHAFIGIQLDAAASQLEEHHFVQKHVVLEDGRTVDFIRKRYRVTLEEIKE